MTNEPSTISSRPDLRFLGRDPLRWIALGFGSGLLVLDRWLSATGWAVVLVIGLGVGWWACTHTARALGVADPSAVVWDEILAFWLVLWLTMPMAFAWQAVAFGLFRLFDAVKRGPVGWADGCFKGERGAAPGWRQGFGILFDDLVAALCTLVLLIIGQYVWTKMHLPTTP
jgi:phosphatidylglycerophosphatase A